MLNTDFLGTTGDAAVEPTAPVESVPDSAVVADPAPDAGSAEPAPVLETPSPETPPQEITGEPPVAEEQPLDEEAELKRLAEDPSTPAFARKKIQEAMGYAGRLKAEREQLQSEFENFRSQFEGKETLGPEDLERLRQAEERVYKLTSFTSAPEEILGSLKEVVQPQKLQAIKNQLTWEFLERPDGTPDLENLQVIVDRFAGEGTEAVNAKDVLNAIHALKKGTIKPYELHEFTTDAEYEVYQRTRTIEQEAEQQRNLAKQNAEFQERQTRQVLLQGVVAGVQSQFQPQVQSLFEKFHLNPVEGEPKVAAEFKQAVRQKVADVVTQATANSQSLADLSKALNLLGEPTGTPVDSIQKEIQEYVNSFPYQTALSRGISEMMQAVEKTVTAEAYRYKLLMMGYEQEISKGQNAREVIGAPAQTDGMKEYTPEQLSKMSAGERRHHLYTQVSEQLRAGKAPRYGG